jgi:hypothetical protein
MEQQEATSEVQLDQNSFLAVPGGQMHQRRSFLMGAH